MSNDKLAERQRFEEWYTTHAHNYSINPIGSRDCALQWDAWEAASQAHAAEAARDAKDAARYRWTVAHWYDLEIILEQFGSLPPGAGSLTAMIDAAMAREAPDAT